jgi:hypothetical protein
MLATIALITLLWLVPLCSYKLYSIHSIDKIRPYLSYSRLSLPPSSSSRLIHESQVVLNAALSLPSIAAKEALSAAKTFSKLSQVVGKLIIVIASVLASMKLKLKRQVRTAASNVMESGWTKRGYGGSFARTVEVWLFAISYLFKYVSLAAYSLVRTII